MNRHAALAPRRSRPRSRYGPLLAAGAVATAAAAAAVYAAAKRAERRYPPTGRIVDVGGIGVHVHVAGEGPPLVLLNGNGTMVRDWIISGLVDRLARRYRVIAIDRPGYGYSERPHGRLWTARAQADLLHRTLARLGVERPIVLGHSWGTLVALALALDQPEAVRGLVLLSGYYFPTGRLDVWAFAPPAIPVLGDLMRYTVSPVLGRMLAPKLSRCRCRAASQAPSRSTSRSAPGRFGRAPRTAPSWCRAPPACRIATASSTSRSRSSQVRRTGSSTLNAKPCASPAGSRTAS